MDSTVRSAFTATSPDALRFCPHVLSLFAGTGHCPADLQAKPGREGTNPFSELVHELLRPVHYRIV
jgi:hypothetical protein